MKMKWVHIKENGVNVAMLSDKGYRIDKIFNVKDKTRQYTLSHPVLIKQSGGFVKKIGYSETSADAVAACDEHYKKWLSGSSNKSNRNRRI